MLASRRRSGQLGGSRVVLATYPLTLRACGSADLPQLTIAADRCIRMKRYELDLRCYTPHVACYPDGPEEEAIAGSWLPKEITRLQEERDAQRRERDDSRRRAKREARQSFSDGRRDARRAMGLAPDE